MKQSIVLLSNLSTQCGSQLKIVIKLHRCSCKEREVIFYPKPASPDRLAIVKV